MKLFAALRADGKYVAVSAIVYDRHSSYLIVNGIDINNQIRGSNALLLDFAIEYFTDKVKNFDFEGSMHKDIEAFYRKFGGKINEYMRVYKPNFINALFTFAKSVYKKLRYGR